MRFTDFLKATVMTSAAMATLLAAITVATGASQDDQLLVPFSAAWWVIAAITGIWLGRRAETTPPIARLLADARSTHALPELHPARLLLNRLWPMLAATLIAAGLSLLFAQIAAIATGFAIIWALAWRRQDAAVTAIEGRDGVRYFVESTSPLRSIRLIRTPGFKSNLWDLEEAHAAQAAPRE